jgi:hypothetical protein
MDMHFQVGHGVTFGLDIKQSVQFGFDVGGGAPTPPTPPAPQYNVVVFGNPIATDNGFGHYLKPEPTPFFESI